MRTAKQILSNELEILEDDISNFIDNEKTEYVLDVFEKSISKAQREAYNEGQKVLFETIGRFFNQLEKERDETN